MKFLKALWRYWIWVCVVAGTGAVVLGLVAGAYLLFKHTAAPDRDQATECLDQGGTWDAEGLECRTSA
jgi:hypothetical protein